MEHFYLQIPAVAAVDTVSANLLDRITITTRSLWRSDVILLNITSEILLTGSDVLIISSMYIKILERKVSFQIRMADTKSTLKFHRKQR